MILLDIIKYSVNGDLKTTALSDIGNPTDTLTPLTDAQKTNLDTLVGFANQGILELHKRFPLKVETKEVSRDIDDKLVPIVLPEHALSILKVTTLENVEVPLDDMDIEFRHTIGVYKDIYIKSAAVNSYLVLGEYPIGGEVELLFYYMAAPTVLKYDSKLPLPFSYHEALIHYIAYRGYSTIKSVTPVGAEDMSYKKRFEDSCMHLKEITDNLYEYIDYTRLERRCFV
jgi:hypothetical protein